jgi:signal transduction histidine kinase/CheY-like chemotaxis protein
MTTPAVVEGRAQGLLAEAIEALSEGFALFDEAGGLVLCNARFREMTPALSALLLPGASFALLLREAVARGAIDSATAQRLAWAEQRLDPGARREALEFETAGGAVIAASMAATRGGGFTLTLRDVTARRRLAEQTREGDAMLREVLDACPAAVLMARLADGQVMYRSPAATDLVGPIRNLHELLHAPEKRADFITALMPNGRVDAMALDARHAAGGTFPAAISARLIEHRGADVIVASLIDRSQELAMRAELAAQRETIFQNEKLSALGELLAGVAHELNNPLSVVVGHSLMLREETADPEILRRIDKIGQAAERCTRIVQSFLAMARQEAAVLAPVDLEAATQTALDALRNGPGGLRARIELALAGNLPPVMADADQLAQVVMNLVTNADQAIAGTGRAGCIRLVTGDLGERVELRVVDDGPGVPADLRARIFDPFFTTKEVGAGTGLGLALCHRVVSALGGRISVEDNPGGGAVFALRLPAASQRAPRPAAPAHAPGTLAPARVLLVEDEAEVAGMIAEILRRAGFEVTHAASGEEALRLAENGEFNVILSDLAMPGIGGRGFYEALARDHPAAARRVAFVTGDTMSPAARTFLDGTGRPRLEKPIAPDDLRTLMARMLQEGPQ